jgi:hypothetical protein
MTTPTFDAAGQPVGTGNKVAVGLGSGAVLGGALAQIIARVLNTYTHVDMPVPIQMAMASVISTVVAILAAHYTPPNPIAATSP